MKHAFRVTRLPESARAIDVHEYFSAFGQLSMVSLQRQHGASECIVVFDDFPVQLPAHPFLAQHRIAIRSIDHNSIDNIDHSNHDLIDVIDHSDHGFIDNEYHALGVQAVEVGTLIGPALFFCAHRIPSATSNDVTIRLLYSPTERKWQVLFNHFKLEFNFADVASFHLESFSTDLESDLEVLSRLQASSDDTNTSNTVPSILIRLACPPRLYLGTKSYVGLFDEWEWKRQLSTQWTRICSFPFIDHDHGLWADHLTMRFQLTTTMTAADLKLLMKHYDQLAGIVRRPLNTDAAKTTTDHQPIKRIKEVLRPRTMSTERLPPDYVDFLGDNDVRLPFDVKFRLGSLVSFGYLSKWVVSTVFIQHLCDEIDSDPVVGQTKVETVLDMLLKRAEHTYDPLAAYTEMARSLPSHLSSLASSTKSPPGTHCIKIKKVLITPLRQVHVSENMELSNRVLRHFSQLAQHGHFIRVAFTDEHQSTRMNKYVDGIGRGSEIYGRWLGILKQGVHVVGRRYEFLAFSSSQLREHSCWFFAPMRDAETGKQVTAHTIREWMGDFRDIQTVAKYAARLGQCFSSTTPVTMPEDCYRLIPDIERNGYVFSDGIGKIAAQTACLIARAMQLSRVPSAFQFRMGGFKGVLAVDPTISLDSGDPPLYFRPSQRKFTAGHHSTLDIIRISAYSPAFLNHQIITLLNSVDVPDHVFLRLQSDMQRNLDLMMDRPHVALHLLTPYTAENECLRVVCKMMAAGMNAHGNGFLYNVLHLFQCGRLREVKQKARILVPKGVQVMGVLDEVGVLEYGQVFCQFSDPGDDLNTSGSGGGGSDVSGRRRVVSGTVLVAKMPAVHPGDIRVLQCVDHPSLRHYVDVLVFPQKGPRPHPNECSGSDLDGDNYFLTWDSSLIPPLQNFRPLDHDNLVKPEKKDHICIEDVAEFMMDYIENDNLGLIAVAHKVHADLSLSGARSKKCLELARLHSIAVDFPKSGVSAQFDPQSYLVSRYPDFLGKRDKPSYESQKALGKLYRAAHWKSFRPEYSRQLDQTFLVKNFESYLVDLFVLKHHYDAQLDQLMTHYGIKSEWECVSGLVMEFGMWTQKREFELRQALMETMRNVLQACRRVFWQGVGRQRVNRQGAVVGGYEVVDEAGAYQKASAAYYLSYAYQPPQTPSRYDSHSRSRKQQRQNRERPMTSFAWLVAGDVLIEIYKKRREGSMSAYVGLPQIDWDRIEEEVKKRATDEQRAEDLTLSPTVTESVSGARGAMEMTSPYMEQKAYPKTMSWGWRGGQVSGEGSNVTKSFSIPDLLPDGTLDAILKYIAEEQGSVEPSSSHGASLETDAEASSADNGLKVRHDGERSPLIVTASASSPNANVTPTEKQREVEHLSLNVLQLSDSEEEEEK